MLTVSSAPTGLIPLAFRVLGAAMRGVGGGLDRWSTPVAGIGCRLWPNKQVRVVLKANEAWRGRDGGRPALVIASGPSAASVDTTWADGRIVVSVNENHRLLGRLGIVPHYLVAHDEVYWSDARYDAFLPEFEAVARRTGARVVLPFSAFAAVTSRRLFMDQPPPLYTVEFGRLSDFESRARVPSLDLSKPVPGLHSVAHMGVAAALHAGCREIGIVGVDMDYIAKPGSPILHAYGKNSSNDHDGLTAAEAFRIEANRSYPDMLDVASEQLRAYAVLDSVARSVGGRLVNYSAEGLLETIERETFPPMVERNTE